MSGTNCLLKSNLQVTPQSHEARDWPAPSIALVRVFAGTLRRLDVPVKLCQMKRGLIALILILAVGLQGSMVALAATSPLMSSDCQTAAIAHSDASQNSCCPKGQRAMSCCLDLCLSPVCAPMSPIAARTWFAPPLELLAIKSAIFSSRGDSPPIRPPIL